MGSAFGICEFDELTPKGLTAPKMPDFLTYTGERIEELEARIGPVKKGGQYEKILSLNSLNLFL